MTRPTALVTGASSGIGLVFARRLASEGHDVVLVARDEGRLKEVADELQGLGAGTEVLAADLADSDGVAAVEARLRDRARPVDLLVNNAGFGTFGSFTELPLEDEDKEVRLNVLAVVRLTHAALGAMVPRGSGGVINLSSVAAFQAGPYNATYAASKAFVVNFSEAVHEEVKAKGVTVMALCPGFTRTEFQERAGAHARSVPDRLWMEAEPVVDAALRSYRRGAALCVPGPQNKAAATLVHLVPRSLTRRMSGVVGRRLQD